MSLTKGILQAYLDRELSSEENRQIQEHLIGCATCRANLEKLRGNATFTRSGLSAYQTAHQKIPVNTAQAWQRFLCFFPDPASKGNSVPISPASARGQFSSSTLLQRWFIMMRLHHQSVIAASLVIGISCSLVFQPVRAVAAQFLAIFRVENVQTVPVTPAELEQINKVFRDNQGSLRIRNFGEVRLDGKPQAQSVTFAEIKQQYPEAIVPKVLPGGYILRNLTLSDPCRMEIKLNLKQINALLQDMGAKKLLPGDLDGKILTVRIPAVIGARYSDSGNEVMLLVTKSPEMDAPGIDPAAIRDALLELPFLPQELGNRLRAVSDWQHTLIIPSSEASTEPVLINGNPGHYCAAAKNLALLAKFFPEMQAKLSKHPFTEKLGFVLWQFRGDIYLIAGTSGKDTLVSFAEKIY